MAISEPGAERDTVDCDDHCGALLKPVTLAEFEQALLHWMEHSYASGCAHGY